MISGVPDKPKPFRWRTRLKYGLLAAAAAWLAGWIITIPFEYSVAWRYVDGNSRQLPLALLKGLAVWGGFSFFMAMAGFAPMVLPAFLLIPPRWLVRWRLLLILGAPLAAAVAIYRRMGLLHAYRFRHPQAIKAFFFTAPNFFVITFALVVMLVYVMLAKRRLLSDAA